MLERLFGRRRGPTAARQQGDVHALDVEGDPRGGVQSDGYRHASPDDVVQEGETTMSGPGGALRDDSTPDERRERDRS